MEHILVMMLNSVRNGILDNRSVQTPDLLIFIFNMIREYILVDRSSKCSFFAFLLSFGIFC